jgi:hypothetical protein
LLVDRHRQFDAIFVSRPPNMAYARQALAENPSLARNITLVYDAEALFSEREILMHEVLGHPMADAQAKELINKELDLAADTHIVIAVTETIASLFRRAGHRDVRVLGHAVVPQPTPQAFELRQDFLCVGQSLADESPNADAIVWFADRVLPRLQRELGRDVVLKLAGALNSPAVQARIGHGIVTMGRVPDLTETYGSARVFVAPTRYASGIPLKVYEAAARGVPCVITPLLAQQLGWTHRREVLVAATPKEFAKACLKLYTDKALWTKIRKKALARVAKDCSRRAFDRVVRGVVQDIAKRAQ